MANIFVKVLALILLVTATVIECQVILNRNQLATWLPSYLTATSIDLVRRSISLVDSATFSGLSNLQIIYLQYNLLTNIDSNTFSGLTNLNTLDLGANKLTNFSPSTFKDLINLTLLSLALNQISFIDSETFSKIG